VNQIDGLRRYIEAATTLTQITRGRAEELVRELVASGELERIHAQEWIDDLLKRSREASENLMDQVSSEVDRQLGERGVKNIDLDDLADKVAGIIGLAATVGRNVARGRGWQTNGHDEDANNWKKPAPDKSEAGKSSGGKSSKSKSSGPKSVSDKSQKPKSDQKAKNKKKSDGTSAKSPKGAKGEKGSGSKKSEAKKAVDASGTAT
jgi:polyhydroxyalkanoate synthesis regulator phasin